MRIKIFDVGHGSAALVLGRHGERFLVDCAWNRETGFRPSVYIRKNGHAPLDILFNSNMDQDHLSDFLLCRGLRYKCLLYNYSVSSSWLKKIKEEGGLLTSCMTGFLNSMVGPPLTFPQSQSVHWACFWNKYPAFTETNDLSMVTFLEADGICVVFPGDFSKAGWYRLLQDQDFRNYLSRVNVYVAAHHGREDGYCPEMFAKNLCNPEVVIISDAEIQFDTQRMDYSRYARGAWIDGEQYFCMTTRTYGDITIDSSPTGLRIVTAKGLPKKRSALATALLANRRQPLTPSPLPHRSPLARALSTPPPAPKTGLMSLADFDRGRGLLPLGGMPPSYPSLSSFLEPPKPAFDLTSPLTPSRSLLDFLNPPPKPAIDPTPLLPPAKSLFDLFPAPPKATFDPFLSASPSTPPGSPGSLLSALIAEAIRRKRGY